ncbi:MAG: chorismate--pyruvate lyase [Gammaproteobacteria bacterium]|nr:chorismate--pyruvate lyase [Gammaproteobacteria bacterium]
MQPKRINKWLNGSELEEALNDQKILSWLNEEGSITERISSIAKFKLEVLNDDIGIAEDEEYRSLEINFDEARIREVILYGDILPIVYARSIIPNLTEVNGFPELGTIGSKPLGDLLFNSKLFDKTRREYSKFKNLDGGVIWGRRTFYLVKDYPLSVMEVFLNP